jgi:hypothetical protein
MESHKRACNSIRGFQSGDIGILVVVLEGFLSPKVEVYLLTPGLPKKM